MTIIFHRHASLAMLRGLAPIMDSPIDKAKPSPKGLPRKATRVVIFFPSKPFVTHRADQADQANHIFRLVDWGSRRRHFH